MGPRHQVGQRVAPARKGYRNACDRKFVREQIFLFLRCYRRVSGDEAGSGERVLRKVAFDQEPPGGCRRQLRPPGRNFVIGSARRLELIKKFESRGESIGAESILGQCVLQSVGPPENRSRPVADGFVAFRVAKERARWEWNSF